MTTQSYTFETIQELNDKKAELIAAYGSENIVPNVQHCCSCGLGLQNVTIKH